MRCARYLQWHANCFYQSVGQQAGGRGGRFTTIIGDLPGPFAKRFDAVATAIEAGRIHSKHCLMQDTARVSRASAGGPVVYPRKATVLPAFHGNAGIFSVRQRQAEPDMTASA